MQSGWALLCLALLLLPAPTSAQLQSRNQRTCITTLNQGFAKIASRQAVEIRRCLRDFAKQKLSGLALEDCLTADRKGKVAKAEAGLAQRAASKCETPPDFGPRDPDRVGQAAIDEELALVHALFGPDLEAAIALRAADRALWSCQQKLVTLAFKCRKQKLKAFNDCKKQALRDPGAVTSAAELHARCLEDPGTGGIPDPKGKLAKACGTKLSQALADACGGVDPADALPGDCAGAGDLVACLDRRTEIGTCRALATADELDVAACDLTVCPAGTHLVHRTGGLGIELSDDFEPGDVRRDEYRCVPDATCTGVDCSGHGSCGLQTGHASCDCDAGYAGARCEVCAVGYERNAADACVLGAECRARRCSGQGDCVDDGLDITCRCDAGASGAFCEDGFSGPDPDVLRAPTRIRVAGNERSVERGGSVRLVAELSGGGNIDTNLNWRIVSGGGSLSASSGSTVTYTAPPEDGTPTLDVVAIEVGPACCPGGAVEIGVTLVPLGGVPVTGEAHKLLEPLDQAMVDFMESRCVGAGVLGVALYGKPVFLRGYGRMNGANSQNALFTCDVGYDPNAALVEPDTPMRVASLSKAVTAAVARKAVRQLFADKFGNPNASDAQIESALLDEIELGLLSPDVRDVFVGNVPPPLPLPMQGDPNTFCPDLAQDADSRLKDITVGHLLGHRSGITRDSGFSGNQIRANLKVQRDLTDEGDWGLQELILRNEFGFPQGSFANEFPNFQAAKTEIPSGYFPPRPTVDEQLKVQFGRCLDFTPGMAEQYSNQGYLLLARIAEVLGEQPFGATTGKPGTHVGSALESFLQDDLGFPYAGQSTPEGLYIGQRVLRLAVPREPVYRDWDAGDQTYYKLRSDGKRQHCIWDGNDCDFGQWQNDTLRFDWDFVEADTFETYSTEAFQTNGGPFGVATEAEAYLRFMAKYWAGGSGANPMYGERRNNNWGTYLRHSGSLIGTGAWAMQLGPDLIRYELPFLDPNTGRIDFSTWDAAPTAAEVTTQSFRCVLPAGVDVFVTINQRTDKACTEALTQGPKGVAKYGCRQTSGAEDAYNLLDDFILHGVCQVPWPNNPYVLWPPVK